MLLQEIGVFTNYLKDMLGRSNQGMVRIPIFSSPMCLKEYRVNHATLPIV
jgi:hypothetical protein